ncbi:MAG: glycoside hydrolase family 25 [Eubacterium sp.]|nr:glycoside hydrolase family 25 [Eubacterium sp.]
MTRKLRITTTIGYKKEKSHRKERVYKKRGSYEIEEEDAYEEEDYDDKSVRLPKNTLIIAAVAALALAVFIILFIVVKGVFFSVSDGEETESVMSEENIVTQDADSTPDTEQGQQTPEEQSVDREPSMEQPEEAEALVPDSTEAETEPDAESQDPQDANMSTEQGTEVNVAELLSSGSVTETNQVTVGIDVAKYQGTIDWTQVAASGIDFAMVRVGYRADASREICADTNAKYNMQEAQKNGIKVGAYFFSTAASTEEAKEEADWVADYISQYQITYPVAYDCEGFDQPDSAQYNLTNAQRTDIAIAFLQEIYNRGYTPMFYASMGELSGNAKWDTTRIEGTYRIWVSQYPSTPYPQTAKSSYGGTHAMWQYTNRGTVAGIGRPVDVNVAYFGYEGTAQAQNNETPEEAHADVEALMKFTEVNENVTAKDSTNLRNVPSQGADSTVVYTLKNGETVARTGVSDSGWSRLSYNGQTVYAVSSYLTTDLGYQAPVQEGAGSGDGLKTKFAARSDQVTAKIEVNLRALPSVTNPDATVVAVLHNGEYVTRTGINEEYGWSRVDYNGQTLYCISSYLTN